MRLYAGRHWQGRLYALRTSWGFGVFAWWGYAPSFNAQVGPFLLSVYREPKEQR